MLPNDIKQWGPERISDFFKDKRILVTGGTGSFGHEIVSQLLEMEIREVVVFSRDEKKHFDMRNEIIDDRLRFELGDVRDSERIREVIDKRIDIVYHAAALKQVPYCEDHPMEAVKTNILGAENVRKASILASVDLVLALSTDKACKPINVMGMTKAVQERIFIHATGGHDGTKFVCVRYGNVLGSRGSVVPFFKERAETGRPIPVTNPEMTRFWLTLKESVELVFYASVHGNDGDLFVRKMPACTLLDLAEVMNVNFGKGSPIEFVGIRPGEKIHEILVSEEEMQRAHEEELYFKIQRFGTKGKANRLKEYGSDTTRRMDADEIASMLKKEGWL
jgi:UDP-glucose 4-epimerase